MASRFSGSTTRRSQRIASRSLALLAAACAKHPPSTAAELQANPRVPAPEAGTYARVTDLPPDPVVAHLLETYRYDASLGGAAAGLALEASQGTGGFTPWELRESAWRAGWPYPVSQLRAWQTPHGAEPPEALNAWLAQLPEGQSVGLVRVRADASDSWVGLASAPAVDLGVIRRLMKSGDTVDFPAVPGGTLVVGDPAGNVGTYATDEPRSVPLTRSGEWIFDLRQGKDTLARFPVYADMVAPKLNLFSVAPLPDDPVERTLALIGEIREAYGRAPWTRDPTLDTAASSALDGSFDMLAALGKLGFSSDGAAVWSCESTSVEGCLDSVVWRPEYRRAFLLDVPLLGLAVRSTGDRVRMEAVVTPE